MNNKINEKELADIFIEWFWFNRDEIIKNKSFWRKNVFGRELSHALKEVNCWKCRTRGNPKKGYTKMKESEQNRPVNESDLDF